MVKASTLELTLTILVSIFTSPVATNFVRKQYIYSKLYSKINKKTTYNYYREWMHNPTTSAEFIMSTYIGFICIVRLLLQYFCWEDIYLKMRWILNWAGQKIKKFIINIPRLDEIRWILPFRPIHPSPLIWGLNVWNLVSRMVVRLTIPSPHGRSTYTYI